MTSSGTKVIVVVLLLLLIAGIVGGIWYWNGSGDAENDGDDEEDDDGDMSGGDDDVDVILTVRRDLDDAGGLSFRTLQFTVDGEVVKTVNLVEGHDLNTFAEKVARGSRVGIKVGDDLGNVWTVSALTIDGKTHHTEGWSSKQVHVTNESGRRVTSGGTYERWKEHTADRPGATFELVLSEF